MMLKLQRYDIIIKYKKGKEMYLADALSRILPLMETTVTEDDCEEAYGVQRVNKIFKEIADVNQLDLDLNDELIKEIKNETTVDPVMKKLKQACLEGWPHKKTWMDIDVTPFWKHQEQIVTANGIIFRGSRIIVPVKLRKDMINKIHNGHMGIE